MIRQTGSIKLSSPLGGRRFARTKDNIQNVYAQRKEYQLENYQLFPREVFGE